MAATKAPANSQVEIRALGVETILVPIIGTAPLIQHRFSEKAKKQMLDAMQGRKSPKVAKDPEAEYEASLYRLKDGAGFGAPAVSFKSAIVGAARFFGSDVTMVMLRQSVFVRGRIGADGVPLVPIVGEPVSREDVVRVNRGGTDLRYRGMFEEWSCDLQVTFVKSMLTRDSVLSLIDAAGLGVGIGEWRPERSGDFGTFTVDPDREVEYLS